VGVRPSARQPRRVQGSLFESAYPGVAPPRLRKGVRPICDGDIVTVRKMDSADDGDIVVALLDDEATIKVLRRQDGQVWLMPRNPAYEPIPGDQAQILGKVVGVLRLF
ncbi:LexA family protein, partial [Streptomyces mirabilis]|uniref:LexA family protein n=1 Tax=Streptomyces mirabilis TaxID=68239 RepID=UPI0036CDFBE3